MRLDPSNFRFIESVVIGQQLIDSPEAEIAPDFDDTNIINEYTRPLLQILQVFPD